MADVHKEGCPFEGAMMVKMKSHDEILEEHSKELGIQREQINQLRNDSIRLENIVMNENRETRQTITENNNKVMELMNNILGFKTTEGQQKQTVTITQWESIVKMVTLLGGSGGFLYWLFSQGG